MNASLPDGRGHRFHCRLYEIDELREIASSRGMLFLLSQYIPCQCDRLGVDRVTSTHLGFFKQNVLTNVNNNARLRVISITYISGSQLVNNNTALTLNVYDAM